MRDLLTAHGIPFWLDYGALLGAVRNGHLIPWDVDVDFGILAEDVPSVLRLATEIKAKGHDLDASDPLLLRVTFSTVNKLHLDLYWWGEHDGLLSYVGPPGWDWPGSAGTEAFPPSYLDPMTTVWLEGEPFPAPSPTEPFLADHRYGSGWREPRRPVRVPGRAPAIGPDEMTEQVSCLIAAMVEAEEMLDSKTAGHLLGHTEGWRRWVDSGTPLHAAPAILATLEAQHGSPDSELVRQLLETIAILHEGLAEQSHPTAMTLVRRNRRRLIRVVRRSRLITSRFGPAHRTTSAGSTSQGSPDS